MTSDPTIIAAVSRKLGALAVNLAKVRPDVHWAQAEVLDCAEMLRGREVKPAAEAPNCRLEDEDRENFVPTTPGGQG